MVTDRSHSVTRGNSPRRNCLRPGGGVGCSRWPPSNTAGLGQRQQQQDADGAHSNKHRKHRMNHVSRCPRSFVSVHGAPSSATLDSATVGPMCLSSGERPTGPPSPHGVAGTVCGCARPRRRRPTGAGPANSSLWGCSTGLRRRKTYRGRPPKLLIRRPHQNRGGWVPPCRFGASSPDGSPSHSAAWASGDAARDDE